MTSVLDRPGIIDIARQGLRLVEGIEVANDEELASLLQRDNNRDDPTRFHKPAFLQNPVHVTSKRERSSARDLVADTLAARNEDGTQKYPLTVSFNSLASRVLFGNNPAAKGKPKAVGVEYLYGEALYSADQRYDPSTEGELRTVLATKEVIVAGGAFNTPQILKLSGIGPKEELKAHGIPVVVDLPAVVSPSCSASIYYCLDSQPCREAIFTTTRRAESASAPRLTGRGILLRAAYWDRQQTLTKITAWLNG